MLPQPPQTHWETCAALSQAARAVLCSLRFDSPNPQLFADLDERGWRDLLAYCDHMKITLIVADRWLNYFPDWARLRLERDLANNRERHSRQLAALREIDLAFRAAGIEYLLLKGLSHDAGYVSPPWLRHQCDLDLFHLHGSIADAQQVLSELDFEAAGDYEGLPMDHAPAMVRAKSWEWHGDYFDPNIPIVVEPHFRWWDSETEQLPAAGLDAFWERRTRIEIEGLSVPVLDPHDRITYAGLHALRHVLRGDVRLCHAYEIAHFLNHTADDDEWWATWEKRTCPDVKQYCATVFELARSWFGCRLSDAVRQQIAQLPPAVSNWLQEYAASPVVGDFHPNKDELWLHLALLPSDASKWQVISRRVFPHTLPTPVTLPLTAEHRRSPVSRIRETLRYGGHLAARARYHATALAGLAGGLARKRMAVANLGTDFWKYLIAASFYHLGIFISVLVYNLHLTDLGFDESFVGFVTSAMTAGSIAGALPGGWLAQRFGLRAMLLTAFFAVPAVGMLRAIAQTEATLLASAFVAGVLFSFWVVCIAPTIAGLVPKSSRARAFSLFFATSISTGILGGLLGGRLPGLFTSNGAFQLSPNQATVLVGCAVTALAWLPGIRIRGLMKPQAKAMRYPRSGFLLKFLPIIFVWNLAIGAVNPFFNIYFVERLQLPVERLGDLFASAQVVQVVAILAAPFLLLRFGAVKAISAMQGAAGLGLLFIAVGQPLWLPCGAYLIYMSFQWMSEPGLHDLLMSKVDEGERTAASSLNYTTIFTAHAVAAASAGWAISHWGYSLVLATAAGIAIVAAILFRVGLAGAASSDGPS